MQFAFYRINYINNMVLLGDVQLSVTNNVASMEVSVITEFVNFVALTMQDTLVRTVPSSFLVFLFAKMCCRKMHLGNTAHPVSQVYCNNWKKLL